MITARMKEGNSLTRPIPNAIDRQLLAEQTFGDLALQREILGMFVAELPVLLHVIAATEGLRRGETAHRLKGSSVAIGAVHLSEAAAALELDPDNGDLLSRLERAAEAAAGEAAELLRSG